MGFTEAMGMLGEAMFGPSPRDRLAIEEYHRRKLDEQLQAMGAEGQPLTGIRPGMTNLRKFATALGMNQPEMREPTARDLQAYKEGQRYSEDLVRKRRLEGVADVDRIKKDVRAAWSFDKMQKQFGWEEEDREWNRRFLQAQTRRMESSAEGGGKGGGAFGFSASDLKMLPFVNTEIAEADMLYKDAVDEWKKLQGDSEFMKGPNSAQTLRAIRERRNAAMEYKIRLTQLLQTDGTTNIGEDHPWYRKLLALKMRAEGNSNEDILEAVGLGSNDPMDPKNRKVILQQLGIGDMVSIADRISGAESGGPKLESFQQPGYRYENEGVGWLGGAAHTPGD